jgi:tripartite-type tricarboxylate transporter receptor subunit TctC
MCVAGLGFASGHLRARAPIKQGGIHVQQGFRAFAFVAALAASLSFFHSAASAFPDKPVRIVVGFTPGGPADAIARSLSDRLSTMWGQPVIVENMPGASGAIAANTVARAAADGHTLLLADASSFVVLPHLRSKLPFDPRRDFAAVSIVGRQVPVLAIRASAGPKSIKEMLELAKSKPEGLSYGTWGIGSWSHVKMEQLAKLAGVKLVHVPYRGAAPVITDMLGGRVDLFLGAYGLFEVHEKSGAIRILATGAEKRPSFRPDLPTIAESGVPGFSVSVWFGLVAPAGTPAAVLDKINADIAKVQAQADYREKFLTPQRLEAGSETPQQFKAIVEKEFDDWGKTIASAGIPKVD